MEDAYLNMKSLPTKTTKRSNSVSLRKREEQAAALKTSHMDGLTSEVADGRQQLWAAKSFRTVFCQGVLISPNNSNN